MRSYILVVAAVCSFFVVSAMGQSQTTYSSTTPFICDAASLRPVSNFSQFSCRGIKLSLGGNVVGSFYHFSNGVVQIAVPNIPYPSDIYDSYVTRIDKFTEPAGGNPGTFQFDYQIEDANGVLHNGIAAITWEDYVICGGNGCRWHAPKLLTFTTSIN